MNIIYLPSNYEEYLESMNDQFKLYIENHGIISDKIIKTIRNDVLAQYLQTKGFEEHANLLE